MSLVLDAPLTIPRTPALRGAHARGFDARLRGVSRYSCPYDRPGWGVTFRAAWIHGWLAADSIAIPPVHVNVDDHYPEETQ